MKLWVYNYYDIVWIKRVLLLLFKCYLIVYFFIMYLVGIIVSIKDSNNIFINREVDLEVLYGLDFGR